MSSDNNLKGKALKAGVWYSISNILLRAISIITAPIFTRLLTTSDYGVVSNYTSWQNILVVFCGLGLEYSIGRAKVDFKDHFDGYISSVQGLSSLFSCFILIVYLPFSNTISSFMELDNYIVIALLVNLIFYPSIGYMQAKLRFKYRYIENIIIAAISTLSTVLLSIVLILLGNSEYKYVGRIFGNVIPSFLIAIVCYILIWRNGKKIINITYWKYGLKFSLPMIPHALAMVILGQIDRIMIVKYCGNGEAGIYSFGYSYAVILSVVTNAIMNAWQPYLYDCMRANKSSDIILSNKILNKFSAVMTMGFIAIAPEVLMILGSKDFWNAKWMIAPVAIGTLFQFYYSYFVYVEMYEKKTFIVAIGSVGAALANAILNYIFIPKYGYLAAAYTTMIGYLLLMIYHWCAYRIIYGKSIFAEKQILVCTILTTFVGLLLTFLYEDILIRYIVICIIGGVYLMGNYKQFREILLVLKKEKS